MESRIRFALAAALTLGLLAPPASAQKEKPAEKSGTVTGKVTFKGQPLAGGIIGFWSKDSAEKTALAKDGSYSLSGLPAGEYRVTVSTKVLKGKPGYVAIPEKYGNADTSGLKVRVGGKQEANIELK